MALLITPVTPFGLNLPPFFALLTALETCPKVFFAFESIPFGPPLVLAFTAFIALLTALLYTDVLFFLYFFAVGTKAAKNLSLATFTSSWIPDSSKYCCAAYPPAASPHGTPMYGLAMALATGGAAATAPLAK